MTESGIQVPDLLVCVVDATLVQLGFVPVSWPTKVRFDETLNCLRMRGLSDD